MRFAVFLFWIPSLFAAYVGNPADAAIMNTGLFTPQNPFFKATTGYIFDYTSNKDYSIANESTPVDPQIKQFALHTQSASASLILLERLELFGTAGGSKQKASTKDTTSFLVDFHGAYQFSWSVGAKAILLQWGQTFFCADFTYFAIPSSPKSFFKFLNRLNLPIDMSKQNFYLREWQVGAALASRFYFITPYAGTMYLRSKLHINSGPETGVIDYYNKRNWGFFYGVTLSITGRLHITLERRVRDEFAYTIGTNAVF